MSSIGDGAEVWKQIRERLKEQLPRETYATWVAQAEVISLQDGVLRLGVGNGYARDRLAQIDRLEPVASEVVGTQTRVVVVVPGDARPESSPSPAMAPHEITVQPVYRSEYDELVRPEQAIPLPRYYLRWVPFLGVDLAWIPVGFRQVSFFRGLAFEAGERFQASLREIALWSGMSMRSLQRKVDDPRLRWFVRRADVEPRWRISADGRPHQEALTWQVEASMPLTPADQASLERFLRQRLKDGLSPAQAVHAAYQMPVDQLLPWPDPSELPEMGEAPRSVQDVAKHVLGQVTGEPSVRQAVDALAFRVAGYAEPVYVGYHYLREELPQLGAGPGWFIQWLRALAADQRSHGQVVVRGGYASIGAALGVTTRTVTRWITEANAKGSNLSRFVSDTRVVRLSDGSVDFVLAVQQADPLTETAGMPGGQSDIHSRSADGQTVPHRAEPEGHSDIHTKVPQGQTVHHSGEAEGQGDHHGAAGLTDILTPFNGGGGSIPQQSRIEESSTSINQATLSAGGQYGLHGNGQWDMARLLDLACVHPANRRMLRQASPVAYVSWLLYWASDLGKRLVDPVGHAVSRLKDAPMEPMEGAFRRLAGLGPDALEELMVPVILDPWVFHTGSRDWDDAMGQASRDRLKRVAELLGFKLEAWELVDEDEAESGGADR